MILITGTFRIAPERVDDARHAMRRMILASRSEEGCLEYAYGEDVLLAGLVHVHELWRDQACLDRHAASDHIKAWRATWPELGIGDRDLVAFDVGDSRRV